MALNELNHKWQQEFQEIPVPVEKLDDCLEQAIQVAQQSAHPQAKKNKVNKGYLWLTRRKHRRLIAAMSGLFVLLGATIIGIYSLKNNYGQSTSAIGTQEYSSQAAANPESNVADEQADENQGKIVYQYTIQQRTTDFDTSIEQLQELVDEKKGYIDASDISTDASEKLKTGFLTLRIPESQRQEFFKELAELGEITSQQQISNSYGQQYQDNESRLNALSTEETALLELLEKSDKIEDMLKIQERLSTIRSEKESITRQQQTIDQDVAYSTIVLTLTEVSEQKIKEESESMITRIKNNWAKQFDFWQNLMTAIGIFLASNFLYLLIVAIVGLIAWRRFFHRQKEQ